MAASSAFPTFSAVTIPRDRIRRTGERCGDDDEVATQVAPLEKELPDHLALSDGGVLDNLGVTSIMAKMGPPESPDSFYLIASDAGAIVDQKMSPPRGRIRKLHYVMRQFEMRGGHNDDMSTFLALTHFRHLNMKGVVMFRIQRAVPHAGETLEDAKSLAEIGTRLKRIPEKQYEALLKHAGNLVWTRLSEYTDLLSPELEMPNVKKRSRFD